LGVGWNEVNFDQSAFLFGKETMGIAASGSAGGIGMYPRLVDEYKATLVERLNPPAPNMMRF
jgi:hypothetical protein